MNYGTTELSMHEFVLSRLPFECYGVSDALTASHIQDHWVFTQNSKSYVYDMRIVERPMVTLNDL